MLSTCCLFSLAKDKLGHRLNFVWWMWWSDHHHHLKGSRDRHHAPPLNQVLRNVSCEMHVIVILIWHKFKWHLIAVFIYIYIIRSICTNPAQEKYFYTLLLGRRSVYTLLIGAGKAGEVFIYASQYILIKVYICYQVSVGAQCSLAWWWSTRQGNCFAPFEGLTMA